MGVIEIAYHGQDEFVSNIFTRDKKDGSKRMILNLVKLNQFIRYQHFKMDTIDTVIDLMRANCFMASVDLSNAYFSIPVSKADRRFLRFLWHEQLYQFAVLPNGLSCAPRMFTKVLKPIYGHLREQGHMAAGYIDDSFIMADTYVGCRNSIMYTENLFTSLGFFVNYAKSVLVPTHELEHLGFLLNSTNMTVSLTLPKKLNLIDKCRLMLEDYTHTIRSLAELIGLMVSSFTGVEFGRLHYRQLELDKVNALKFAAGNFDAAVILSQPAKLEIQWWIDHTMIEIRRIDHGPFAFSLTTDASELGWGAIFETLGEEGVQLSTGGQWNLEEKREHINVLQLKAALLGIRTFCTECDSTHVKVHMDNTTAIAYINHMGESHSPRCNEIAQEFWEFCRLHNLWVRAAHLPGHLNVLADERSRIFDNKTEWKLNPHVFELIARNFGSPNIDLFASRLNYQVKPYVAWMPDPEASFTDAFTLNWATTQILRFSTQG